MASFTIEEVLKAVDGVLVRRGNAGLCRGVSTDTRTLEEGNLFIPLSGEHFDGHRFLSSAAEKGAAAVVVSNREAADNLPPASRPSPRGIRSARWRIWPVFTGSVFPCRSWR